MYSLVSISIESPWHSVKRPMLSPGSSTVKRSLATGSGVGDPLVTALMLATVAPRSHQVHGAAGPLALGEQLAAQLLDDGVGQGVDVDVRPRGAGRRGRSVGSGRRGRVRVGRLLAAHGPGRGAERDVRR